MNGLLQTLQHSLLENKKAIPKRELWVPDLSALCFEMPLGVLRMGPLTQPGGKGQEGGIWPKPGGEPGGSAKGAAEGERKQGLVETVCWGRCCRIEEPGEEAAPGGREHTSTTLYRSPSFC